jgi:GNAT superfamily N-acetyltransferase
MAKAHMEALVRHRVYSAQELAALDAPDRQTSWVPSPDVLYGPKTLVARAQGQIIAGIELWQQQRDRYWFLEGLIRDPASQFRGVGHELVDSAIGWFDRVNVNSYGLRVHSMVREAAAVRFWTQHFQRDPDFTGAFVRWRGFDFRVVGWIIRPRSLPLPGRVPPTRS